MNHHHDVRDYGYQVVPAPVQMGLGLAPVLVVWYLIDWLDTCRYQFIGAIIYPVQYLANAILWPNAVTNFYGNGSALFLLMFFGVALMLVAAPLLILARAARWLCRSLTHYFTEPV